MSLGKNIPHDSARMHVTGESIYIDDRPSLGGELFVGYVGSPMAAGILKSIEISEALKLPGVAGIYTSKDFQNNLWGTIVEEQPILVESTIAYYDEPICIIAAENQEVKKAHPVFYRRTRASLYNRPSHRKK